MKGFETNTPANDNINYAKFEVLDHEWQSQCEEVSSVASELSALANMAMHETGGEAHITRSIEMIQLALMLQEILSKPRQPTTLTDRSD